MNEHDFLIVHHQLLEEDIVNWLAKLKGIDIRKALDIYYQSRLAKDVEEGRFGLDCMSPKWLAEDLIENEPEFFEGSASQGNVLG